MENALDVFVDAKKKIHTLDIPSKEMVDNLISAAMRNVALELNMVSIEGFHGAVDTLDKVKAVEDYIKVKRGQLKADLVTQNKVAVARLYIVRDIGKWLKKYLAHRKHSVNVDAQNNNEFWIEELGINRHQSSDWQMVASIPTQEFDQWLSQFVSDAEKLEAELTLEKLLDYIRPETKTENKDKGGIHQNLRDYYRVFLGKISTGELSRDALVREIDTWNSTKEYVDKVLREAGELF